MKKVIIALLVLFTVTTQAQDRKRELESKKRSFMKDFSAEEMATLQTKRMTLHLDLTEDQQRKIKRINLENAKVRKAKMEARKNMDKSKLTKNERYEMMNERLDRQISTKQKMKKILTEAQYEKFEKMQKGKKRFKKRGKQKQRKMRERSKQ